MSEKPPLRPAEVRRILRDLKPLSEDRRIVLVGGQAVAFWAAFFDLSDEDKLFTSKDIDFEGAARSARKAGELAPYGLDSRDVRDSAVMLTVPGPSGSAVPVWVMHPERCMESRVYNVVRLKQSGPIALDQLVQAVICAREFSYYLLGAEAVPEAERIRAVLRLNERIFRKCLKDRAFLDVYFDREVDPFEAVVVDDRLPDRFCARRYHQMTERLEERRRRSRAQRERYRRNTRPRV